MTCPNCLVELRITQRQGVEIDYCPKCRGVSLGRGELDSILERSNASHYFFDEEDDAIGPNGGRTHSREERSVDQRDIVRRALPRNDSFEFN